MSVCVCECVCDEKRVKNISLKQNKTKSIFKASCFLNHTLLPVLSSLILQFVRDVRFFNSH